MTESEGAVIAMRAALAEAAGNDKRVARKFGIAAIGLLGAAGSAALINIDLLAVILGCGGSVVGGISLTQGIRSRVLRYSAEDKETSNVIKAYNLHRSLGHFLNATGKNRKADR